MEAPGVVEVVLPADVRSVREARRLVCDALTEVGSEHLWDEAGLAVSELVTNAVVHTGGRVPLHIRATGAGLRVEVSDTSHHLPSSQGFAPTAGTGRGLQLVEASTDRWGVTPTPTGKTVWFEIGTVGDEQDLPPTSPTAPPTATVRLLDVPLLMHWAWQEHAQSLLREYLLFALEDDPAVLEQHASASAALSVLHGQIPKPELPHDPDGLLADTLEPGVTAQLLTIDVPGDAADDFAVLDALLARAAERADSGHFLGPPTQPEIGEMREWLCTEVIEQVSGGHDPRPWRARTDVRTPLEEGEGLVRRYAELAGGDAHVLVTNTASVIVAVSESVARFLGYEDSHDLLGRRIIVVVPPRYHQAHIAGTTLNATNGRDALLGIRLTVPMLRADGTEVPVELSVSPRLLGETRVFVADITLPQES